MNQLFKIITYCHSQNIINRDLKPENIMITGRDDLKKLINYIFKYYYSIFSFV